MNLKATAVTIDSNGVPLDANGLPLFAGTIGTDSTPASSLTTLLNTIGQGISNRETAVQTNIGIETISRVATIGIVVWGIVRIFGRKR